VATLDDSGNRLQRLEERFSLGLQKIHLYFLDDDDDHDLLGG
jgi:hypothetical protein